MNLRIISVEGNKITVEDRDGARDKHGGLPKSTFFIPDVDGFEVGDRVEIVLRKA